MLPLQIEYSTLFFFFNDTATTEIYTLSLHDALPIWTPSRFPRVLADVGHVLIREPDGADHPRRSEEHTSELQSQSNLVCRLLLEKKKKMAPYLTMLVASYHV